MNERGTKQNTQKFVLAPGFSGRGRNGANNEHGCMAVLFCHFRYMIIPVGVERYFVAMELGVVLFSCITAVLWKQGLKHYNSANS